MLVDPIVDWGRGRPAGHTHWCHMASDDLTEHGVEELHAMADALGLRREWFQGHSLVPHYDLPPTKRQEAIERGAIPVSLREMALRCVVPRRRLTTDG